MLIAKGGFQLCGGMIFTMPYLAPSAAIFRIYSIGSRNSSSVGLNVGASGRPNSRCGCVRSTAWSGPPLRSTVDRSIASARRALSGMAWLFPDGGPFKVPGIDGVISFGLSGFIDGPGMGDAVDGGGMPGRGPPTTIGGAAISKASGRCGPVIVDSICSLAAAEQPVSVTKALTKSCGRVACAQPGISERRRRSGISALQRNYLRSPIKLTAVLSEMCRCALPGAC